MSYLTYGESNISKHTYRGFHEKGSGDVVSAVCHTIFTIYLPLCTRPVETTSPEPFSLTPLYNAELYPLYCLILRYNSEFHWMKEKFNYSWHHHDQLLMQGLSRENINSMLLFLDLCAMTRVRLDFLNSSKQCSIM